MNQKAILLFTLFTLLLLETQSCSVTRTKSYIRGNYKNVLEFPEGAVISSRKKNTFAGDFANGVMFRDSIYQIDGVAGFTYCSPGDSIEILLLQPYELNTLIFWLWDIHVTRTYNLIVYVKYGNQETIIHDTIATKSIVRIHFPDQLVQSFRIYNRGGNTENTGMYLIKCEAYYKF